MTKEQADTLITAHLTGSLSPGEKSLLYTEALRNPDLFDELMEIEEYRETLEIPEHRRAALEATRPESRLGTMFAALFNMRVLILAGSLAVFILAVLLWRIGSQSGSENSSTITELSVTSARPLSPELIRSAFQLPEVAHISLNVKWRSSNPDFHAGQILQFEVNVGSPCRLLVLLEQPDHSLEQIYPAADDKSKLITPDTPLTISQPAGNQPGSYQLRILAVPPSFPSDASKIVVWTSWLDSMTVLQRPYTISMQ